MDGNMAVFRTPPQHPPFRVAPQALFYYLTPDSVTHDDIDEDWEGLEISTPVQGLDELQRGIPEIRSLVQGLSHWNQGVAVTQLCGLHIHVGDQNGLTLDLAKRIVTLVVLLEEDLLFRLVSSDRQESEYFLPITHTSRMALYADSKDSTDEPVLTNILPPGHEQGRWWSVSGHKIGHILQVLWQCPNLDSLEGGLISPKIERGWKSSLFLAMRLKSDSVSGDDDDDDENDPVTSSIEFRYPQMSFDSDFVQMWVEVATRIVEVAGQTEDRTYQRVVRNVLGHLDRIESTNIVPQLLVALGFDRATINRWGQMVARHDEGQDPTLIGSGPYRKLRSDL